jgi:DNA-binding NarL/FixJ family response regulator
MTKQFLITAKRPDIILLDLMIPAMSGDKMLQAMRKQEWGASIKVIVLTNISRADAPPILNDLNIDRYIVKAQMTPSQIVEIVREVLGEK